MTINGTIHRILAAIFFICLAACTPDDSTGTSSEPAIKQNVPQSGEVKPANTESPQAPDSNTSLPVHVFAPDWPRPLPNNWAIGQVPGIAVDSHDHIWIQHRPRTLTEVLANDPEVKVAPAPSIIEFDQDGNVIQAWGGPTWDPLAKVWTDPAEGWPSNEHGLFIDDNDNIWLTANGTDDQANHVVYKYSRDGRRLLTIGHITETKGSNDSEYLGRPADITVDTERNEVYIADGYGNRRVIVFNADTGAYKRHWGAYGETPHDGPIADYDPEAEPLHSFRSPVHSVRIADNGLVYVADRVSDRFQVFSKDGQFIKEKFIAPQTLGNGSVWDLEFSPDQSWLYVADGNNDKIWILDHATLEVTGSFGEHGEQPGQFNWIHNITADSLGNIYTSQVRPGQWVQKFALR